MATKKDLEKKLVEAKAEAEKVISGDNSSAMLDKLTMAVFNKGRELDEGLAMGRDTSKLQVEFDKLETDLTKEKRRLAIITGVYERKLRDIVAVEKELNALCAKEAIDKCKGSFANYFELRKSMVASIGDILSACNEAHSFGMETETFLRANGFGASGPFPATYGLSQLFTILTSEISGKK